MTVITGPTVEPPESLGVDPDKLDALRTRVRQEVDAGLLPACQFALARHGRLAAFEAFGKATTKDRFLVFSATKAIVASTVWQLIAEGLLDVDCPVAHYIPEFATNGKDVVTVEQVMLHTAGFPYAPMGPPAWDTSEGRSAAFAQWRLDWEPGTRFEYHATSAHWVLAELIERLGGQDHRDAVEQRVTRPLGLPRLLGIAEDDQAGIVDLELCGEPTPPEELQAALGLAELPETDVTDDVLLALNLPLVRAAGIPGGGGIATAATMALFYQGLLHNDRGLWDPAVLADATGRVRSSLPDPVTRVPVNRGLGVVIAGDDGKATQRAGGFGHANSPRAFGHDGAGGQIAWADPETGLSFCYLTSGNDAHLLRQRRRTVGIASRAAACVAPR
jgi:CubicO group peptidase (beta-lactamase class C family)